MWKWIVINKNTNSLVSEIRRLINAKNVSIHVWLVLELLKINAQDANPISILIKQIINVLLQMDALMGNIQIGVLLFGLAQLNVQYITIMRTTYQKPAKDVINLV